MQQTKFFTLLKSLSTKEFNDFKRYFQGIYHKRNRELSVLNYIDNFKEEKFSKLLTKNGALEIELKKEGITEENLKSNILPNLYQYLEEFLAWQKFKSKKHSFQKEKLVLEVFQERQLSHLVENKIKKLKKRLQSNCKSMWTSLKLFELFYLEYFAHSSEKKIIKGSEMSKLMENLDGFFINAKLKLACEQKFREKVAGKSIPINFLNCVQIQFQEGIHKNNPLNQLYSLSLELIEESNEQKYQQLKELIIKYYQQEEEMDQSIPFGFILNYCANELKKGSVIHIEEMSMWIKFGLKNKLFFYNDYIHPVIFNNQINIACGINNLELADEIVEKYGDFIKPSQRRDTLIIANAYIDFEREAYAKIIDNLNLQKISDRILNLRARLILLKTYYEYQEFADLGDFIKASIKAINITKDLGRINKMSAKNTLKFTQKLMNPNNDFKKIKEAVKASEYIFSKNWILEKIEEYL